MEKIMSNDFSLPLREISQDEFVILSDEDMAKRETIGKRLNSARLELGMSVPQLRKKIDEDHRAEIGESTIRDIEKDKTPNPGFKTIEFIALGVGLDPLEVIGLGLDDPPEMEQGFKASQFAQLWKSYSKLDKEQRAFVDDYIETLILKIDKWR
jgi:transcriptional regulator with XRE-family HTH domain